jgi:phosphatidylinositol alpha-1,6-mannosyltransferase
VKLLMTLDFPPENGGIQRYLHDIVRFRYGPEDLVVVGCLPALAAHNDDLKTPVRRVATVFRARNKKLSLIGMATTLLAVWVRHRRGLLVECGNVYAGIPAWLFSRVTGQPYLVYTYGTELVALRRRSFKSTVLRSVLKGARRLFTLGSYTSALVRRAGIERPLDIVAPKIVLPPPDQTVRRTVEGRFRVLSVGRLVEHKGHDKLFEAVAMLPSECNWELVVVGEGPRAEALEALRQTHPRAHRIHLRKRLSAEEMADEYRRADAFVLPSLETDLGTEGFGIVLLEAMAYDVPIAASAAGGIVEVLEEGACGLLVEPGSAEQLFRALVRLWENPDLCSKLTRAARKRLLAHYVWN